VPDDTTLYILCGLPFSGKSTLAAALARWAGGEVVSLDAINAERGLFGGDGIPVEEWERTSAMAVRRAEEWLAGGTAVVLDDTTSRRFLRDRYRELAGRVGARAVLVYLDISPAEIRRRRARNEETGERRGLVDAVFDDTAATFEAPGPDEVRITYRGEKLDTWLEEHLDRAAG